MLSERGCHFCEFCENDARFPWVELIDFPNNSLNFHEKRTNSLKFYEKRTNSLNIHEKRTFSEKGCRFCEFCENDARFPWVEFIDFRKIGPRTWTRTPNTNMNTNMNTNTEPNTNRTLPWSRTQAKPNQTHFRTDLAFSNTRTAFSAHPGIYIGGVLGAIGVVLGSIRTDIGGYWMATDGR